MASKRLQKELNDITNKPPENWIVGIKDENLFEWEATLIGPPGTPYEGGRFKISIKFKPDYPFKIPDVTFLTRICSPNVNGKGYICWISRMADDHRWSPAFTISKVLDAICSVLKEPEIGCSMIPELRNLYQKDKAKYEETVREWTRKYAMNDDNQIVQEQTTAD